VSVSEYYCVRSVKRLCEMSKTKLEQRDMTVDYIDNHFQVRGRPKIPLPSTRHTQLVKGASEALQRAAMSVRICVICEALQGTEKG